jgi:hypothetical protein
VWAAHSLLAFQHLAADSEIQPEECLSFSESKLASKGFFKS